MSKYLKSITMIGLCFGLVQAVQISGVVKESTTGNPIANAAIYGNNEDYTVEFEGLTGENGYYKIPNDVPAGSYEFYIRATGYAELVKTVTIEAVDSVTLDFKLDLVNMDGYVKGIVKNPDGNPLDSAMVYIRKKKCVTGVDGKFKFDSLQTGEVEIDIKRNGYVDTTIKVVISKETPEIEVSLTKAVFTSVKGTVLDTSGKPIANVRITVGYDLKTYSGADGKFSFDTIQTGKKSWYISHKTYRDTTFDLTLGTNPTELVIKLTPVAVSSISGIVKDLETQKPIEGVIVEIDEIEGSANYFDTTDINGAYSFDSLKVSEQGWKIYLNKEGYDEISDNFILTADKPLELNLDMVPVKEAGIDDQRSSPFATAPAFRYSCGVLNLVNISESGEMRVFNLNGKLLFGQKINRNCSVIALPRNVISNRTTLIVYINAGKNNLKQAIMPFK